VRRPTLMAETPPAPNERGLIIVRLLRERAEKTTLVNATSQNRNLCGRPTRVSRGRTQTGGIFVTYPVHAPDTCLTLRRRPISERSCRAALPGVMVWTIGGPLPPGPGGLLRSRCSPHTGTGRCGGGPRRWTAIAFVLHRVRPVHAVGPLPARAHICQHGRRTEFAQTSDQQAPGSHQYEDCPRKRPVWSVDRGERCWRLRLCE
jgi:hypothetical protein